MYQVDFSDGSLQEFASMNQVEAAIQEKFHKQAEFPVDIYRDGLPIKFNLNLNIDIPDKLYDYPPIEYVYAYMRKNGTLYSRTNQLSPAIWSTKRGAASAKFRSKNGKIIKLKITSFEEM